MWLPDALINDVKALEARVFYLPYGAARRWAENRDPGEPLVFSGWYWARGGKEAGPFRSQSAAWRDCWYVLGRHHAPSITKHADDFAREMEREADKPRPTRRKRGTR
jgi:hypothetical protein